MRLRHLPTEKLPICLYFSFGGAESAPGVFEDSWAVLVPSPPVFAAVVASAPEFPARWAAAVSSEVAVGAAGDFAAAVFSDS